MPSPEWLTVPEVLDILQVPLSTWEKWRARRLGPPAKRLPSGKLRIRRSDLEAWLDDLEAA